MWRPRLLHVNAMAPANSIPIIIEVNFFIVLPPGFKIALCAFKEQFVFRP